LREQQQQHDNNRTESDRIEPFWFRKKQNKKQKARRVEQRWYAKQKQNGTGTPDVWADKKTKQNKTEQKKRSRSRVGNGVCGFVFVCV